MVFYCKSMENWNRFTHLHFKFSVNLRISKSQSQLTWLPLVNLLKRNSYFFHLGQHCWPRQITTNAHALHSNIAFECCHIRQPFNAKCHAFREVFELKRKLNKTLHIFQLKWNELAKLLSCFFSVFFLLIFSQQYFICACDFVIRQLKCSILKRRSFYLTCQIKSSSKAHKKYKSINRIF